MATRSPRVGLIVDHPKRDLPGAVLIARALAARGVETALIPLYEQAIDVPLLGLDALVLNFARPVNREIAGDYARSGIAVYVLDTEGGVLADDGPSTPHRQAAYLAESGYAGLLAGYFFWGPVLRDAFAEAGVLPFDRLHLTGCPRFDFAAPPMRDAPPPRRTGHVLVNTNYPAVNPRFTGKTGDDRAAMIAAGYGEDYVEALLADTREIMRGMIETVRRLARELPEQKFVLRPHPFENAGAYREAFANRPNATVDGAGDVIEALKGARALVHVNCGTAIEAIMLGVPPLSLEFLNTERTRGHASLPSRASLPVADYHSLVALLSVEPAAFDAAARHAEHVEPWFHRNDGRAAERVADVLAADLGRRPGRGRPSLRRALAASRRRPGLGQRAQALLANFVGSLASSRLRALAQPHRSDKTLDAETVRGLLATLGGPPLETRRGRHPWTKAPLASLIIRVRGEP